MTPPRTPLPMPTPRELPTMSPGAALWRSMLTSLFLFVPAALLNLALTPSGDEGPSAAVAALFYLAILLGAGAGGWAMIRLSPDAALGYASAAPALAYLVVQGFGVIRRLVASEDVRWGAYLFLVLLVSTCGMLGGMFARRLVSGPTGPTDGTSDDDFPTSERDQ